MRFFENHLCKYIQGGGNAPHYPLDLDALLNNDYAY